MFVFLVVATSQRMVIFLAIVNLHVQFFPTTCSVLPSVTRFQTSVGFVAAEVHPQTSHSVDNEIIKLPIVF
jgi:hypothetical protein